jgi:hypothetical protein
MTISLERPLVVASAAVGQHLIADPYDKPLVTLELRATVSRDQLAAAVDESMCRFHGGYDDHHPDTWTVAEIRYHAEFQLLYWCALDLQRGAEAMAELADPDYPEQWAHDIATAVYRAVDRAFPNLATHEG